MLKGLLAVLLFIVQSSVFALGCSKASSTDSSDFCPTFKVAATCYCTSSGLPSGMCQDMNALYNRMISVFGSLKKACEFQHYTTPQECIDNWNCYLFGGVDSRGRLCNVNKQPCK